MQIVHELLFPEHCIAVAFVLGSRLICASDRPTGTSENELFNPDRDINISNRCRR